MFPAEPACFFIEPKGKKENHDPGPQGPSFPLHLTGQEARVPRTHSGLLPGGKKDPGISGGDAEGYGKASHSGAAITFT